MSSLRIWSIVVILYQTLICILISYWTLSCRFVPDSSELQEITLMKLLYLYDPEACGRLYFYNFTVNFNTEYRSAIIWPVQNKVASQFRHKIQLWLCLHVVWFLFGVANLTHGRRLCGYYATLVPFTIAGVTILLVDLIYLGLFINDLENTKNEISIIRYIDSSKNNVKRMSKPFPYNAEDRDDTSWIALLFAYCSCRGIVQWFINFWLVKDNYYAGLSNYHRLQKELSSRHLSNV